MARPCGPASTAASCCSRSSHLPSASATVRAQAAHVGELHRVLGADVLAPREQLRVDWRGSPPVRARSIRRDAGCRRSPVNSGPRCIRVLLRPVIREPVADAADGAIVAGGASAVASVLPARPAVRGAGGGWRRRRRALRLGQRRGAHVLDVGERAGEERVDERLALLRGRQRRVAERARFREDAAAALVARQRAASARVLALGALMSTADGSTNSIIDVAASSAWLTAIGVCFSTSGCLSQ